MKFVTGNAADLSDKQLLNNIAIIKSGNLDLDTEGQVTSFNEERFLKLHEDLLISRGYTQSQIDTKVSDIINSNVWDNDEKPNFWGKANTVLDTAGNLGDVIGKYAGFFKKGGKSQSDDGSDYVIDPGQDKEFNYKPFAIGGGILFVAIIGLLMFMNKNKDDKK